MAHFVQLDAGLAASLHVAATMAAICNLARGAWASWTLRAKSRRMSHPEQLERYKPWFDNNRRLRQLTKELEAFSL